jgi:hypothetical protein
MTPPLAVLHRLAGLAFLGLASAAGACRPADEAAGSASAEPAAWTLAATPLLHVGGDAAPGHELDRVFGGALLPDGGLVVGNSGTGELRFFDRHGTLTRAAGRKGRGPGEFQAVSWLRPYRGDSLLVFDLYLQRFSVWTRAGEFARSFQLPADWPAARAVGVFPDGGIAFAVDQQPDPRAAQGIARTEFHLVRVDPAGEHPDTVGRFAGPDWLLYRRSGSFAATQPPFGRTAHTEVSGEAMLYASSDTGAVQVYGPGGRLVRTFQVAGTPRKLQRDEVEKALDQISDPAEREAIRGYRRNLAASTAPRIEDLRVDRTGNVWIRTYSPAPGMSRWMVTTIAGEQIGSIDLPSGAVPLDIDRERILLREADEDGVQRVSVRGITR